jgi:hypothetical protein
MALVTAAEMRVHLPSLEGVDEDPVLDDLLEESEGLLATYAGWPLDDANAASFGVSTYTFLLNGPAFREPRALCICVHPMTVTTVEIVDPLTGLYSVLPDTNYVVDSNAGIILLLPGATITEWPTAYRAIRVEVEAGYAVAPAALRMMIIATARHLWNLRNTQGQTSYSMGGDSASLADSAALIPQSVRDLIDRGGWRLC